MTFTNNSRPVRHAIALALVVGLSACKASDLNIANPNNATVEGASADPTSFQLLASGLLVDQRSTRAGWITYSGILGRESYTYTPQEGRNTTHYLVGIVVNGVQKLDPTGFATAPWGGQYSALRDIFNFKRTVAAQPLLSAAQKSASLGFAQTLEAMMLFEIEEGHDSLGAVVEIRDDPTSLAPFVSRDSVFKYALNTLDAANTNLAAGSPAFPFPMPSGFANFNTPATFVKFNRAMKGKIAAHYATLGGGATAWAASIAALNASFMDLTATTRTALDVGVYDTYAASPDSPNSLTQATNTSLYGHMSFKTDVQTKPGGASDDRYTAKIRTGLPSRKGPVTSDGDTSAPSTIGFSIWPTISSNIPIIRNEELILLHAEAMLATGNKAAAIADINQVRINSGGLPASTLTVANTDDEVLMGILYEKRYSTMMEGNRWVDMRRYNKLNLLPLDITSGPNKNFVAKVGPVPQAECLVRANSTGDLLGPGGLNDCAP